MALQIDKASANAALARALDTARSDAELSAEWIAAATEVAGFSAVTYVAALGTALLAKATDARVDAMALKATDATDAYSARGLCHGVLVPASVRERFDLGATGREPLNNQPFFRYNRIDEMERVRNESEVQRFVEIISAVNRLDRDGAELALAAFLRQRLRFFNVKQALEFEFDRTSLPRQLTAAEQLLREETEGGKRAQAFVAACLDIAHTEVRTSRINDPSVRFPGDVHVVEGTRIVAAWEVRAKSVSATEVEQFCRGLPAAGVGRAGLAMFAATQPALDWCSLGARVWDEYGIHAVFYTTPKPLLLDCITWSIQPIADLLASFPSKLDRRLRELEVEPATRRRWDELLTL